MAELRRLEDRDEIAEYLSSNRALNIYQLGDLDDFFWPHTEWWSWSEGDKILAIALLYRSSSAETLIVLEDRNLVDCQLLLRAALANFPNNMYAHVSPALEAELAEQFIVEPHGTHLKMHLQDRQLANERASRGAVILTIDDRQEIEAFFAAAYPGNWFDPRMLATGQYFGIREYDRLVAAGGVHVLSRQYGVAALGNIATHPSWRGRGLATAITAAIVHNLPKAIVDIGLNVNAENAAAITCYRNLGFVEIARYRELSVTRKRE